MKYDIDYFINKFEAIPEEKWTTGKFQTQDGKCCALGFCGNDWELPNTEESKALVKIDPMISISNINDGVCGYKQMYGETPKARILNFLKQKKAGL